MKRYFLGPTTVDHGYLFVWIRKESMNVEPHQPLPEENSGDINQQDLELYQETQHRLRQFDHTAAFFSGWSHDPFHACPVHDLMDTISRETQHVVNPIWFRGRIHRMGVDKHGEIMAFATGPLQDGTFSQDILVHSCVVARRTAPFLFVTDKEIMYTLVNDSPRPKALCARLYTPPPAYYLALPPG